jgi:hypothetical protein
LRLAVGVDKCFRRSRHVYGHGDCAKPGDCDSDSDLTYRLNQVWISNNHRHGEYRRFRHTLPNIRDRFERSNGEFQRDSFKRSLRKGRDLDLERRGMLGERVRDSIVSD